MPEIFIVTRKSIPAGKQARAFKMSRKTPERGLDRRLVVHKKRLASMPISVDFIYTNRAVKLSAALPSSFLKYL
jgi:hypothetical protein